MRKVKLQCKKIEQKPRTNEQLQLINKQVATLKLNIPHGHRNGPEREGSPAPTQAAQPPPMSAGRRRKQWQLSLTLH